MRISLNARYKKEESEYIFGRGLFSSARYFFRLNNKYRMVKK